MASPIHLNISKVRRDYNSWVANKTLEEYAQAFSTFISLGLAFVITPCVALFTNQRH